MKNLKSISILTLIFVLTLSLGALAWNDGVYVGKADGHNGPITLEVTVEDGNIVAIEILDHNETPMISDAGFGVIDAIIEKQSTEVDTVSGATVTSKAVFNAVENALGGLTDGKYTGEGEGFKGPIAVEVEVQDGKIVAISILSHDETPFLSDAAFEAVPEAIIATQSTDVDTLTGATATSKGIIQAVNNALGN